MMITYLVSAGMDIFPSLSFFPFILLPTFELAWYLDSNVLAIWIKRDVGDIGIYIKNWNICLNLISTD